MTVAIAVRAVAVAAKVATLDEVADSGAVADLQAVSAAADSEVLLAAAVVLAGPQEALVAADLVVHRVVLAVEDSAAVVLAGLLADLVAADSVAADLVAADLVAADLVAADLVAAVIAGVDSAP